MQVLFKKKKNILKSRLTGALSSYAINFLKFMGCITFGKLSFNLRTEEKNNKKHVNVFLGLLACYTRLLTNIRVKYDYKGGIKIRKY